MTFVRTLCVLAALSVGAFGQSINFSVPISLAATNSAGSGFTYVGTLTQAATIAFSTSGLACEQGSAYCTNPAGVVVIAGSTGVGGTSTFAGTFGGTSGTWNFGSLIMIISSVGAVQVFPANAGNGLGSPTPPGSFSLPSTSLSALGFPSFSAVNPTITFVVADTNYLDNSGTVTLFQGALPGTPIPGSLLLVLCGILGLAAVVASRRRIVRA